jgi:MYXO-CTERM domain-containing protein
LLLIADIDGANPFPADPAAMLFAAITDKRYAWSDNFSLGTGPCVSTPWPAADTAQVRFGVVNIAGEFSGWGEASTAALPPEEGGCQLAGGGGGQRAPWTVAALALALLWLRRRRSTT